MWDTDGRVSLPRSRLAALGNRVGIRMHLLFIAKERPTQKREHRLLSILYYLHDTLYRFIFGKAADSLEMSNDSPDECKKGRCPASNVL